MKAKILVLSLALSSVSAAHVGCGGSTTSDTDLTNAAGTSSAGTSGGGSDSGGSDSGGSDPGGSGSGGSGKGGSAGGSAGTTGGGAGAGGAAGAGAGSAGAAGTGEETDVFSGPTVCTSDKKWTQGNHESPNMHPGGTCISCHKQLEPNKQSIQFTVAGTVYATGHEPDDCNGINPTTTKGVEVIITGADGTETTIPVTLGSGNFYKKFTLQKPYKARVSYNGKVREMTEAQTDGNCNSCHTEQGDQGAPGRIALP